MHISGQVSRWRIVCGGCDREDRGIGDQPCTSVGASAAQGAGATVVLREKTGCVCACVCVCV